MRSGGKTSSLPAVVATEGIKQTHHLYHWFSATVYMTLQLCAMVDKSFKSCDSHLPTLCPQRWCSNWGWWYWWMKTVEWKSQEWTERTQSACILPPGLGLPAQTLIPFQRLECRPSSYQLLEPSEWRQQFQYTVNRLCTVNIAHPFARQWGNRKEDIVNFKWGYPCDENRWPTEEGKREEGKREEVRERRGRERRGGERKGRERRGWERRKERRGEERGGEERGEEERGGEERGGEERGGEREEGKRKTHDVRRESCELASSRRQCWLKTNIKLPKLVGLGTCKIQSETRIMNKRITKERFLAVK